MKNTGFIALVIAAAVGGSMLLTAESEPEPQPAYSPPSVPETPPVEEIEKPTPSETGPWPAVLVPATDFQFGSMLVGTEREHVFKIKNAGSASLELVAGKATCKCTKFELSRSVVPPGEEAELQMRWHGKFNDMNFQHGGPVFTNDPKREKINFSVRGVVDSPVVITPADSWSLTAASGETGNTKGYVFSRVHDDFKIESLTDAENILDTVARRLTKTDAEELLHQKGVLCAYEVSVSLKPEARPGVLKTHIELSLDCTDEPSLIEFIGNKAGPIKILARPGTLWSETKNGLVMGRFPKEKGREQTLDLLVDQADMEGALELTSVTSDPAFLAVELGEGLAVGDSKFRYPLKIAIAPGIAAGSRSSQKPGKIKLQTNHPSGQQIEISISYTAF